jgi:tetratricopeptide (TPR) repeat protein
MSQPVDPCQESIDDGSESTVSPAALQRLSVNEHGQPPHALTNTDSALASPPNCKSGNTGSGPGSRVDLSVIRAYSEELEGWPRLCLTHSTSWTLHPLYSKEELCESGSLRVSIVKSSKEGPKTAPHTEYVIVIKTAFSVRSICRRTADFARLDAALRPRYPSLRQLPAKRFMYTAIPNLFLNEAKIAADRLKQLQLYVNDVMELAAASCHPALMQFLGSDRFAEEMQALGRLPRASSCRQRGVWRPEDAAAQLEHAVMQMSNLQQICGCSSADDHSHDHQSPVSDSGGNDSGGAASAAETTAISVMSDSHKLQFATCMHRVALLRVMLSLCPPASKRAQFVPSPQQYLDDSTSNLSVLSHSPHSPLHARLPSHSLSEQAHFVSPPSSYTPASASTSLHLSPISSTPLPLHAASPAAASLGSSSPKDKVETWSLQLQESCKLLSQAASICMAFGDAHGALAATSNLSVTLLLDGRIEQALELCDRCIEAATKLGDICCLVLVLSNAAYMYLSTGACDAAVDAACAAMEAARDSSEGDIFRAFEAGMRIHLAMRDFAQLFNIGEQALRMLRPSKDVFGLAAIMFALGSSFSLQSYHAHAKDYFDQAAAQCRAVGDVQGLVLCLLGSAESSSELGENEKGLQVGVLKVFLSATIQFFDACCQLLREALHICCRAGDAASECIVRAALCTRVIDSGDAKDALTIGQDGQAAALRLLSVAGSGRRHPSCWGLDPIHTASQLEACIRRAKSLVQVSRMSCTVLS